MSREFISEIELLRLKQTCHNAADKIDAILFPNNDNSVNNMNCDEINQCIENYINSKFNDDNIKQSLYYIIQYFSGGEIRMSENYNYTANLISEIVVKKSTFYNNIENICK